MHKFKEVVRFMCQHPAALGLGWATGDLLMEDYKSAAWILFVVSIIYLVGYFTERFSK